MLDPTDPLMDATTATAETPTLSKLCSKLASWQAGRRLPSDLDANEIADALARLAASLMRAPDDRNGESLRRLFERYPKWSPPSNEGAFWNDWLDDVRDWPGELVALACSRWRNSPAKREPHTAGELRPLIQAIWNARRVARDKLKAAQAALTQRAPDAADALAHGIAGARDEGGPWSQFCADLRRRMGDERAAYYLHNVALFDGVLWTGSHAVVSILKRDAGDILDAHRFAVAFFPDRYKRLTKDRPPLVERDPTPEERRMIVAGLRRHAAALRTSATAKRRPFHARRAASQDERQAQIDDMESDT